MTTENNRKQILALAKSISMDKVCAVAYAEAFYHAAIQHYKDSVLKEVGEPYTTFYRDGVPHGPDLYTADQLIAARKPLEEEIAKLKQQLEEIKNAS